MDFIGKVVVITGASSGLGAACALAFAKLSASLSLIGRNVNNLTNITEKCEEISGRKPLPVIADLSIDEDVKRIVTTTVNVYGKLDVLVNNAGFSLLSSVSDGIEAFDRIMATNLRGTYLLTNLFIPHLIETKGVIVNVSSMLSTHPMGMMSPYCISKAALDMFTKCVALELAPKGVRVNSVNPGPMKTQFFKRSGFNDETCDTIYKGIEVNTPLNRICTTEDVVEIIIFLASDKAKCVTGSFYYSDGGLGLGNVSLK